MGRGTHFYAVDADLAPVLADVEAKHEVAYVRIGSYSSDNPDVFRRGADIPQLGSADHETATICTSYLVLRSDALPALQPIKIGASRYDFDQRSHAGSIVLTPAGLWKPRVVLFGRVATVHETPEATALMRAFGSAIRRRFEKVRAFWVGPAALNQMRSGARLTIAEQSPSSFDLRKEAQSEG